MSNTKQYVVCLSNEGYRASLIVQRVYELRPDPDASRHGLLRVIDESGEDYLFPATLFRAVQSPTELRQHRGM